MKPTEIRFYFSGRHTRAQVAQALRSAADALEAEPIATKVMSGVAQFDGQHAGVSLGVSFILADIAPDAEGGAR